MNFSPDSKFMHLCGRLAALCKINLLWLVCCLPLFTAGASTCAMLGALSAMKAEEECGSKVFFRHFRACFRRATVLWLAALFLGAMLVLDYRIVAYLDFPGRMAVIVVICFCLLALALVTEMLFPLIVHFPGTLRDTVINAVLLSFANLPKLLLITAMNALPALLVIVLPQVFVFFSCLLPVCGFSLIGLYDLNVTDKIFAALEARGKANGEEAPE